MKRTLPVFQALRDHPLFPQIDLKRAYNKYVVVDITNPDNLLYVSERAYLKLVGVTVSNDEVLTTLLVPGERVPVDSSGRPVPSTPKTDSSSSDEDNPGIIPSQREGLLDLVQSIPIVEESFLPVELERIKTESLESKDSGSTEYLIPDPLSFSPFMSTPWVMTEDESFLYGPSWYPSTSGKTPFSATDSTSSSDPVKELFNKLSPNSKRHYSLIGRLSSQPRSEEAPNFLEVSSHNMGPILREWGGTLHIRILGKTVTPPFLLNLLSMIVFLKKADKASGTLYMLKYIKCTYLYLLGYLSGKRYVDPWIFGTPVALSNGLPSWIPAQFRARLRSGDLKLWKWILSFIFSYKGLMTAAPKPTLDSIESPTWDGSTAWATLSEHYPTFKTWVEKYHGPVDGHKVFPGAPIMWDNIPKEYGPGSSYVPPTVDRVTSVLEIHTSGPNGRPSVAMAGLDALAWHSKGSGNLINYCNKSANWQVLIQYQAALLQSVQVVQYPFGGPSLVIPEPHELRSGWVLVRDGPSSLRMDSIQRLNLGRLSLKPEAAGKVRVFAIVDYWTQCALKPLHNFLQDILSWLPTDASVDQGAAFEAFINKKHSHVVSYDLSNATDMLPLQIQTVLLAWFVGTDLAMAWEALLKDREYAVPKGTSCSKTHVRYTRGQPIGALSSWDILALTHHFLVFIAAARAGVSDYTDYVVCGDDIALGGTVVPPKYQELCEELGVPLSIPKTLFSSTDMNTRPGWTFSGATTSFVSRIAQGVTDLTPWSLKEEVSVLDLGSRLESCIRRIERKQIPLDNSWLNSVAKSAMTRFSDVERVAKAFTSGEFTDSLKELLAPLLFPSPRQCRVLGLKEGDVIPWLSVVTENPGILSHGASLLQQKFSPPKGFPVETFVDELLLIIWSRVVSAYDIASSNTRLLDMWVAIQESQRQAQFLGSFAFGFLTTSILTRTVLRSRVVSEQVKINEIVSHMRGYMDEIIHGPISSVAPGMDLNHRLQVLAKALKEIELMPLPEPLPFMSPRKRGLPKDETGFISSSAMKWVLEKMKCRRVDDLSSFPIPVHDRSFMKMTGLVPLPISRRLTPMFAVIVEPEHPDNVEDQSKYDYTSHTSLFTLIPLLLRWEDRCTSVSQLFEFPTFEGSEDESLDFESYTFLPRDGDSHPPEISVRNPMFRSDIADDTCSDQYVEHVLESKEWFQKSAFQKNPWSPDLTSDDVVRSPFSSKEAVKTSFGLSRHGKSFNRTLDLLASLRLSSSHKQVSSNSGPQSSQLHDSEWPLSMV